MNEAETRQELITPAIRTAGWDGNECRIRPEFPITKGRLIGGGQRTPSLSADYVLGVSQPQNCRGGGQSPG